MDLHKRIAADVKSKKDRDRAAEFLRALYGKAIQGTDWETLWNELDQAADPVDPTDLVELYEAEDRGVAVAWPDEGMGFAWVWSDGWREAPGLVNKSWLDGHRLSRSAFARQYPSADLAALEILATTAIQESSKRTR